MAASAIQTIVIGKKATMIMNAGQTSSTSPRPSAPLKPSHAAATGVSLLSPSKKEKAAPTRAEIEKKAYEIWLSLGKEPGQDQKHWFEAERQLRQR